MHSESAAVVRQHVSLMLVILLSCVMSTAVKCHQPQLRLMSSHYNVDQSGI